MFANVVAGSLQKVLLLSSNERFRREVLHQLGANTAVNAATTVQQLLLQGQNGDSSSAASDAGDEEQDQDEDEA